ncbi:MAG TPA: hypothetical protein VLT45_15265 [Kofleriaceae bacterium]|nr:hypothetical protein [Kofleriaceae bacterium]
MAIAARARARFGAPGALLALTLLAGHEAPRHEQASAQTRNVAGGVRAEAPPVVALGKIIVPGPFADAAPWPRGMVITPPETGDRMAFGVVPAPGVVAPHPLVTLLSGLFELLGSRGA